MIAKDENEEKKIIVDLYGSLGNIKKIEKETGYSWNKIVKTLSTAGIVCNERHRKILELYNSGNSIEKIAEELEMSSRTVQCYLPRVRPVPGYCVSKNTQRIKEARQRKKEREKRINRKPSKPFVNYLIYTDLSPLTDREREIFLMRQSGTPCWKIAEKCGIKETSVHMALNKALKKLNGKYDREAEREYHRNREKIEREKIRERRREYDKKNREKLNEYHREYYRKNKEKCYAYHKKWLEKRKLQQKEKDDTENN